MTDKKSGVRFIVGYGHSKRQNFYFANIYVSVPAAHGYSSKIAKEYINPAIKLANYPLVENWGVAYLGHTEYRTCYQQLTANNTRELTEKVKDYQAEVQAAVAALMSQPKLPENREETFCVAGLTCRFTVTYFEASIGESIGYRGKLTVYLPAIDNGCSWCFLNDKLVNEKMTVGGEALTKIWGVWNHQAYPVAYRSKTLISFTSSDLKRLDHVINLHMEEVKTHFLMVHSDSGETPKEKALIILPKPIKKTINLLGEDCFVEVFYKVAPSANGENEEVKFIGELSFRFPASNGLLKRKYLEENVALGGELLVKLWGFQENGYRKKTISRHTANSVTEIAQIMDNSVASAVLLLLGIYPPDKETLPEDADTEIFF